MPEAAHILINGLSVGSGGGYTVARELMRNLATARPHWRLSMALIEGVPLHQHMKGETWPANCQLLWAPPAALKRLARAKYENTDLVHWAEREKVSVVVQLNGMMIPRMKAVTLSHYQNPWPFRPEAWGGWKDRVIAALQRRENARALRRAACVGFTSRYLRDLVCGQLGIQPRCSDVYYNGIPDDWIARAQGALPAWEQRPLEIVTVSNVLPYKRQALVIEALGRLVKRPGLEKLKYRIIGDCAPAFKAELEALARTQGVADRVVLEGRVPDARVQEALASARCFTLMSVCESFGIPALEAMSFGTPVVTADCCAMPEVCGEAADLCPMDDLNRLVEDLARVLTDANHAQELRRRGVERVALFSWARTAEQMAQRLDQLADGA